MNRLFAFMVGLSLAGCQQGASTAPANHSAAPAIPSAQSSRSAIPQALEFLGVKAGDAAETWSDGSPMHFLVFRLTNLEPHRVELSGYTRKVGFDVGEPEALLDKSDDGRYWGLAFPLMTEFVAGPDKLQLAPGESAQAVISLPPEIVRGELHAKFVRACLKPSLCSGAISTATLLGSKQSLWSSAKAIHTLPPHPGMTP
jgi:hypothetical protein